MTAPADLSTRVTQAALVLTAVGAGLLSALDPRLGIAAALGVAFVVMVMGDRRIGLYLFTIVAFLDVLPAFGGPLFSVAKLVGLLLAGSWLAASATRRDGRGGLVASNPALAYLLGVLIVWAALSLSWAELIDRGAVDIGRYALNALLLVIVVGTVHRRGDAIGLVTAYVVGATGSALYGMLFTSESTISDPVGRVSGTVGDANELSAVLIVGFVLSLGLTLVARSPALRAGAWACAGVCLAGSFLTLSRGGFVALAVVLAASVAFGGRWRARATWIAALTVLSGALYLAALAPPQALERLARTDGGTGRTDIWLVGWRMVQDQPVLGVGVGNFQTASIHYLLVPGGIERDEFIVDRPLVAHNTYLHVLAEMGVVGLTLFVLVIFLSLRSALRAARRFGADGDRAMELLSRAVLIGLIGILVADFFISQQFSKQLWLLLGMGPALLAVARWTSADDEPLPEEADSALPRGAAVVPA